MDTPRAPVEAKAMREQLRFLPIMFIHLKTTNRFPCLLIFLHTTQAKSDEFKVAAKRPAVLPPFALPYSAKNPGSRHLQVTNCMSRCSNDSSITTSNTICSLLCSEPYAVYAKEYEEALQNKAPAPDTMSRRRVALFPGDSSDAHQLLAIMNILGTPTQEDILAMKLPPFSYEAFTDLVHLAEEIHLMNYWMNHQRSRKCTTINVTIL